MGYKPVLPALTKRHCTCASRPHEQLLETRSRMHPYRTHHCAELRASDVGGKVRLSGRSEEHTSELQSLMRISYAVFCLKKKKNHKHITVKPNIHNHKHTK